MSTRETVEATPDVRAILAGCAHRYHVAYAYTDGFGNIEIGRDTPITDGRDVTALGRYIESLGRADAVVVLSWQRYENVVSAA